MTDVIDVIRRAYGHETWAREKLLTAALNLDNAGFTRSFGVLGSVASRFTHMVDIDVLWMRRIYARESPATLPDRDRFQEIQTFATYCRRVTAARTAALERLTSPELLHVVEFRDTRGRPYRETVGDMLLQVVLHAAHHRGQLLLCLKALGHDLGIIDYYVWAAGEE